MTFLIDTAITGRGPFAGKAYFFHGDRYVRYDWNTEQVDEGYPSSLDEWNLPDGFGDGLHAALNGVDQYEGKAFFFKGDQYVRYDWASGQVDEGYPLPISAWPLPEPFASGIDAAMTGYGEYGRKAYFFKGQSYARYDWVDNELDVLTALSPWQLPSPNGWTVDAALEGDGPYAGKSYFFRHGLYSRYNWITEATDDGYPASIANWGLPETFVYPDGPVRDHVWYVIIDDCDYFQRGNQGHLGNVSSLIAMLSPVAVQIDPIWMGNLSDEFLDDPTLLALWGAGSYTEWFVPPPGRSEHSNCGGPFAAPDWTGVLDRYCEQVRNTVVPILAVCGSHQLLARAFADWGSVGHMVPGGQAIPTVADEFEQGRCLIPCPRLGEKGVFPMRVCAGQEGDPLLTGLPSKLCFVEDHHDEVLAGAHPAFAAVLEPDPDAEPLFVQRSDRAAHANPEDAPSRCQVQALRLDRPDRLLYMTQFHPEASARYYVPGGNPDPLIDVNADQLLRNFIWMARRFWTDRKPSSRRLKP
jgi:hypothetical protein